MSDHTFVEVMKIFATADYCSPAVLQALGRTPAMRERMKKVGFFPPPEDDPERFFRARPTRSREVLSKFGVELPKEEPRLPHSVYIGDRGSGRKIRLDRAALFDRVWSQPVDRLAKEWGLSDRGLSKACHRLQIPVPPRGFWAKSKAGQRMRRPRLPPLKPGEAEEIVIHAP
jgi:hypothetical protein